MDVLEVILLLLAVVAVILFIWLLISDADLSLMWAEKFGKSTKCLGGKVVWITGASSGIGEYLAYELASVGCKLILSARRVDELERVKKQCFLSGKIKEEDILIRQLDLLDFKRHKEITDDIVEYFGHIDILVNNAGRSQRVLIRETDLKVDQNIIELNTIGTISLTKSVLPHMVKRKQGCIAVTSSLSGKMGAPLSASYAASKFALHGWFETARIEYAADNIDFCMMCPGPVISNILNSAFTGDPQKVLNKKMMTGKGRLDTGRCGSLMALAIANKLDEVWICLQPVLFFTYFIQYAPGLSKMFAKKFGMKLVKALRDVDKDE